MADATAEQPKKPGWRKIVVALGNPKTGYMAIFGFAAGLPYARAEVGLSTTRPRNGGQCLRVLKGIGHGTEFAFHVAAPVQPGQGFGAALWYRVAGPGPLGPIWFQIFWARHLATDVHGAMSFGERQFWGEVQTSEDAEVVLDWQEIRFNSRTLDHTAPAPQEAPAWATHVLLSASMVATGPGTELFLADIGGWRM